MRAEEIAHMIKYFATIKIRSCLKRGFAKLGVSRELRDADEPTRLRH